MLACTAKVDGLRLYPLDLLIALISSDTSLPFNEGTEGNSLIRNLVAERLSEYSLVGKCYKYRSSCSHLEGHLKRTIYMEKAVAPHSSTLAWKIPWMEEPDRLQSMGSLRVGHG